MLYKVENKKSINKLYVEYLKCVANKSKHKGEPYWQRKMISIHQKKTTENNKDMLVNISNLPVLC